MSDSGKTPAAANELQFTDEQFIWRFSPNQTAPELLEAIFVGREPLLQNVLGKIEDSANSGATHHVLIYGPRGIGKSHFTSLLHHRLVTNENLNKAVHIAWLNEDETTTSMVQLLVRIYRSLCKWYPEEYSAQWLDELLDQSTDEIASILTRRFIARFENRKLVILVENLNLLFGNLGKDGQHELRTLLQENPFANLVATSQQLFKAVTDRSEPFFGFFQQIPLKPLSLPDAQQLLVKIASAKGQGDLVDFLNTPDGRGRVRAVHDLAGGNHRVYIVLSGFVTRESLDQLVAPFQKMADDLTPYYQERLRGISPLQRQIVELLCREHGTVNPKEIARRLLLDQRSIGKQVRILEEIGYLTSTKRGRETFYELSEPLMRLAYEVKEQSLLEMLIEFLRIWYRPDEIQKLRIAGLCQSTHAYVEAAWERSQTHPDPRLKILNEELEKADAEGRSNELAALWEEKSAASNSSFDWFQAGYYFSEINKEYAKAINCYDQALKVHPGFADAWNNKGTSLSRLGRYEEALTCYDQALKVNPKDTATWNNKGASLYRLGRYEESLACYDQALKINPKNTAAWDNKGNSLYRLGRYEESLAYYDQALKINPKNTAAWDNKGNSLDRLGRYEEALAYYDQALKVNPKDAHAWCNKGVSLDPLGRYEEALACYEEALKVYPGFADAWNNKGVSLSRLGRYEEALTCYDTSTELTPEDPYPRFNRSEAFFAMRRWEEGFNSIRGAFVQSDLGFLGDVETILSLIFRLSEEDAQLQLRISTLVDLYQQAAEEYGFRKPNQGAEDLRSGDEDHAVSATRLGRPSVNPLSHLADGLVKSLAKIDADNVTPDVLGNYLAAVERRVANVSEFEIPLRLFRYGIRYLISGKESEFVELIHPERRILRQALGLLEEF